LTEIPEHLLKRSKERRAALGLPGGEGADAAPAPAEGAPVAAAESAPAPAEGASAETAPVAARAATPEPAAPPPPPPPPPPYVQAAMRRHRIPYWAMPVIVLLPLWAVLYYNSVKVPPKNDDVLAQGAAAYAACSGCHGGSGEGGSGPKLSDGEVLKTWPDPKGMMQWIHLGANAWTDNAANAVYGDPDRPGGPHDTGMHAAIMPAFGDLSAADLAAVTRYIRESLSGGPDETDVVTEELAQEAIDDATDGKLVYKNEDPDEARVKASTASSG
jgi:mono/diheme cytochrome c family protein